MTCTSGALRTFSFHAPRSTICHMQAAEVPRTPRGALPQRGPSLLTRGHLPGCPSPLTTRASPELKNPLTVPHPRFPLLSSLVICFFSVFLSQLLP